MLTRDFTYKIIDSPVGELMLLATERGLAGISWKGDGAGPIRGSSYRQNNRNVVLQKTERQLKEYFAGKRHHFDLPLELKGTPFQEEVWKALLAIPFGETRSYGEIARQIRRPGAVRAVGSANGRNPVAIVVPCHRVINSSGRLGGFGGGARAKAYLLNLEFGSRK